MQKVFQSVSNVSKLPNGFVYLDDIDPTIIQSIRYAGSENFIGTPINGYNSPKAIVTIEAANYLKLIQQELRQENYSLVIYDAYRPQKAVEHFIQWSEVWQDQEMRDRYYPYADKRKLFELGYIAKKSAHSRGSTVDLTIIELGKNIEKAIPIKRHINGKLITYLDDNSVDMFSSFDLMDELSKHDNGEIEAKYLNNRNYLRSKMIKYGFKEYSVEWWHYTLIDEPYKDQYFDFDVE